YSIALQDNYCNVNPSLPNYLCLSGASDFGCSGYDGGPNSNNCTNSAWNAPNIIDRILGAGLTWKAYMEDMPSNCYGSDSGNYAVRHNPFVYYNDIVSNSTRCNQVVPAGTADSALLGDLASTSTASNYMWLTPNVCNDMHDCGIPTGDAYLSVLAPLILGSNVFLNHRAALLLTFDEGYGQPIYTVWAGSVVKTAYSSSTAYSHFSVLSTIESNWNLPPLTTNDQNAPNMNEFFTTQTNPDFSLSANPSTVSFVAGQSATSTISLHATGGFNGTVALTASSSPSGITTSCAPSSISGSQTSTCTFTGSTAGSYTVTVTGTSGSLVHTTSIGVTVTAPPTPDFSITANPASVSFVAGQSASSTISLHSSGGFAGTVSLTVATSPAGLTASCVPTSIAGSQTSTCTISGTTPGSYTAVVTGTSGTLSHSTSIGVAVTGSGPTARFTYSPPVPIANTTVVFDASSSSDSDPNAILEARWDWEGDGLWDTPWSPSLSGQHVFTNGGTYAVTLEILDSSGLVDTAVRSVIVRSADHIPPQVSILSPPDFTVVVAANVTVVGVASDNVGIATIELSTDNATWTPTIGTTSWSGVVSLKAGTNKIYARATDTSGNNHVAVITVIAGNPDQGPGFVPGAIDPTLPVLLVFAGIAALVGTHAFLWNRSRTSRPARKKQSATVRRPEK
ncbi:MAG TPA: alkaline phosphatase family protein, partial [Thermoplasmata archaeon]|nr:alkaline phosphatase family protein [Thermoplasmata archaeon]